MLSATTITDNSETYYHHIPIEEIGRYLHVATAHHNTMLPIVSVGCGNGVLEYQLQQEHQVKNLILIDPAPESYRLYPTTAAEQEYLKPDYALVDDLTVAKPEVIGN